jgi:putative ABC transport system permease protein
VRALRALLVRLASLFDGGRGDREMNAELESHLQLHIDDQMRQGATPEEARRRAVMKLGGVEPAREAYRDRQRLPLVETTVRDIRYALRALVARPGFSVAAILVLALGIGANTAIFSVVYAVLLRPLPYADPGRLVQVWHVPPPKAFPGMTRFSVSPANYLDWKRQNHVFERMSIMRFALFNLGHSGEPETLRGEAVEADFFPMLGVPPILGRTFTADEARLGGPKVVVLGHALWTRRFGAQASIVGRSIALDGEPYTVLGVLPASFRYPDWAELWVPVALTPEQWAVRDNHNAMVLARLKPGVDISTARAEMDTISQRLARQYPVDDSGWGATVIGLHEGLVEDVRPALLVLVGAVGFVLLIACANVANLVLARTLARRREIAVRLALGASRGRVMRQILTETMLLGLAGGALGLLVANSALGLILAFLGDALPTSTSVTLDVPVLVTTLALSIGSGILAGLGAAGRATGATLHDALRQGGRTGSDSSGRRTRGWLVTAEVALSIVLLIGAGLMIRTVLVLQRVDPGFDGRGVITMSIILPEAKYPKPQQLQFYDRLLERVRALPGVEAAGVTNSLPLDPDGGSRWPVAVEGQPAAIAAEQPQVSGNLISPGYLKSLKIPIVRGRDFEAADTLDSRPVVLVSEAMARHFWPDRDPIGQRITCIFFPDTRFEVVGIVRDVRAEGLEATTNTEAMYIAYAQHANPFMSLSVRGASAALLANPITAAVRELDRDQPVTNVRTMESLVDGSISQKRFTMLLLGAFATLALVLAAVGTYSVLAYSVRQRLREIGIRLALGARPGEVVRLVILEGLRPTSLGVALGLAGAAALGGVLSRFVYGVSSMDPATFSAVGAIVLAVGVGASLVPAYRATRVDPITTLREE